jgi:hypothetical protein
MAESNTNGRHGRNAKPKPLVITGYLGVRPNTLYTFRGRMEVKLKARKDSQGRAMPITEDDADALEKLCQSWAAVKRGHMRLHQHYKGKRVMTVAEELTCERGIERSTARMEALEAKLFAPADPLASLLAPFANFDAAKARAVPRCSEREPVRGMRSTSIQKPSDDHSGEASSNSSIPSIPDTPCAAENAVALTQSESQTSIESAEVEIALPGANAAISPQEPHP